MRNVQVLKKAENTHILPEFMQPDNVPALPTPRLGLLPDDQVREHPKGFRRQVKLIEECMISLLGLFDDVEAAPQIISHVGQHQKRLVMLRQLRCYVGGLHAGATSSTPMVALRRMR